MAVGSITPWFPAVTCLAILCYLGSTQGAARLLLQISKRARSAMVKPALIKVGMHCQHTHLDMIDEAFDDT